MRVLHVLDHSIPLHSGYTFRTRSILREQRAVGWETFHVTGAKHQGGNDLPEETADGLHFYRSPRAAGLLARMPALNQLEVIGGLEKRLAEYPERDATRRYAEGSSWDDTTAGQIRVSEAILAARSSKLMLA